MAIKKNINFNDLGLGTKSQSKNYRVLNKNGSFNVKKKNIPALERLNFFHALITMSWARFFLIVFLAYLVVNLLFATAYLLIGTDSLTGVGGTTEWEHFISAFFFSAQTITTLGYGQMAPTGLLANMVAAFESLLGLLTFALATGMVYGRFSKPRAKIRYSNNALIAPYLDMNAFMFRVVNPRNNQLLEVEAQVTVSVKDENTDSRSFYPLELERSKVTFFPYMWTIVHPINNDSPLKGMKAEDFLSKDSEFIISIKAFDESFSQMVYSRSSYKTQEVQWGKKFVYIVKTEDDTVSIDIGRLDETEEIALN